MYEDIPLKRIVYASDLTNLKVEFSKEERCFAIANTRIRVCHYDCFPNIVCKSKEKRIEKALRGHAKFWIVGPKLSLAMQLLEDGDKVKGSLVVLFMNRNISWFRLPGNLKEVSFKAKISSLSLRNEQRFLRQSVENIEIGC